MADAWGQPAERWVAFRKPLIMSVLVRVFLELNRPNTYENTAVFAISAKTSSEIQGFGQDLGKTHWF